MIFSIELLCVNSLRPHELHCSDHAKKLSNRIQIEGIWTAPVLVALKDWVILDGHHRVSAAKRLKLKKIPCCVVEYQHAAISVGSWRDGYSLCKVKVLKAAQSGSLYPIKTSKHCLRFEIPSVQVELQKLQS